MFVPLMYLDFVPPIPSGASRDELSPFIMIIRNCFGIVPVNFHFCQLLFNCLEPGLSHSCKCYHVRMLLNADYRQTYRQSAEEDREKRLNSLVTEICSPHSMYFVAPPTYVLLTFTGVEPIFRNGSFNILCLLSSDKDQAKDIHKRTYHPRPG